MWPCVAHVRTDISEEHIASIIRVQRCHIPEEGILHSHRSENLKSYTFYMTVVCILSLYTYNMKRDRRDRHHTCTHVWRKYEEDFTKHEFTVTVINGDHVWWVHSHRMEISLGDLNA
jgi:hypothetical protein